MAFRDINDLVDQNVKLRGRVLCLSAELESKEEELKVV